MTSGDRTDYVFLGAVVGFICIRGIAVKLPDFSLRAWVVVGAAVVLGPIMGFAFHLLRYGLGFVELKDDWEINLSLLDGAIASVAGGMLMGIMVLASLGLAESEAPSNVETSTSKV